MTSSPPAVRVVEISESDAGRRLDNYLTRELKGVPKTLVYRIIRRGEVRVNGSRARPATRLDSGDKVRIPPVRQAERGSVEISRGAMARVAEAITFEDDRYLIVDKPAGMAVHGGSGIPYGLIDILRELRPNAPVLELGHRLDRETSGCVVIAKDSQALRSFHDQLKQGRVDKRYVALLGGRFGSRDRTVDAALGIARDARGERRSELDQAGKDAVSRFVPQRQWAAVTLVEVVIETGRMHQIRAHAAAIGHPVAGDARYGCPTLNASIREHGLRRMFLHAAAVAFDSDGRGRIAVRAPLPESLERVIQSLDVEQSLSTRA